VKLGITRSGYHTLHELKNRSHYLRTDHAEQDALVSLHQNPVPPGRKAQSETLLNQTSINGIHDEKYIRRTNNVPTESEYPGIRDSIDFNPKGVIHKTPRRTFSINSEFSPASRPNVIRCYVYISNGEDLEGPQIVAMGESLERVGKRVCLL
jgi:hypothetical protein